VHTNVFALIASVLLVVLFGYALSWIFATVGLVVGDPETAQAAAFPVMAPLVFASNAFVPVASMPDWLQYWAEHQPLSAVVTAVRDLTIGGPTTFDVVVAVLWCVGILAISAPIAVHRYRRTA
jgi:ABC-2 type transport system permease protein